MRFLTPALVRRMHRDKLAAGEWEAAWDGYVRHVERLQSKFPRSLRRLVGTTFHDCKISKILFAGKGSVEVELRGYRRNYRTDGEIDGIHRIKFEHVVSSNLSFDDLNRIWLYEEFDFKRGESELRVMLAGKITSDVVIRFGEVSMESKPRS